MSGLAWPDQMRTNRPKRGFADHLRGLARQARCFNAERATWFSVGCRLSATSSTSFGSRGCSGSDIAPLHFANNPMQQTGTDHFMLAKLHRNVIKEGVAVRYREGFGGFHQPGEIVVGQSQSQLVEWGHSKLPKKGECCNPDLVHSAIR